MSRKLALTLLIALVAFPTVPQAADKITFVTDYGLYGRHAYYFVAMEKDYYARENLEVEIVRSPGSANTIKQVANGTAQVGFADAFAVVLGRANDDIPVKLAAMIYPKPPHAVYVLKESGLASPKDFEGKTLADTAFSSVPKLFATYAKAAGVDSSKVKWIAVNSDALPGMLTTGRVDGIGQFTVGEPLLAAAAAPKQVLGFSYAGAGLDYYSNGIVASDAMIESNPGLVRRFLAATLEGLKSAIADPKEAELANVQRLAILSVHCPEIAHTAKISRVQRRVADQITHCPGFGKLEALVTGAGFVRYEHELRTFVSFYRDADALLASISSSSFGNSLVDASRVGRARIRYALDRLLEPRRVAHKGIRLERYVAFAMGRKPVEA